VACSAGHRGGQPAQKIDRTVFVRSHTRHVKRGCGHPRISMNIHPKHSSCQPPSRMLSFL
jgi:hypothetical protein